ncbi:hypothetical protein CC2G_013560 [Coprinopsis cinerea AmutBmut pab1-1]|nr:hypothetical protein CC2G_013560 [Coprinopsis cinerea AmutBmut pab1-1]
MTTLPSQLLGDNMTLANGVSGESYRGALTIFFLAAALESVLNGVFLVLTFSALYLWFTRSYGLFNGGNRAASSPNQRMANAKFWGKCAAFLRHISSPLVFGSVLLILTVTGHWICVLVRLLRAASIVEDNRSPIWFYGDLSQPTFVLLSLIVTISIPIADSLLTWRLWIVSRKSKLLVIPPILCAIIFLACGLRVTVWFAKAEGPWHHFFHPDIKNWILCDTILTGV